MWLVDENLPPRLFRIFKKYGIDCQSAEFAGVSGMKNGVLTRRIAELGFSCILTQDRLFAQDAALALREFPHLAVVVIQLSQVPARTYLIRFEELLQREPIVPQAGLVVFWPSK